MQRDVIGYSKDFTNDINHELNDWPTTLLVEKNKVSQLEMSNEPSVGNKAGCIARVEQ